MTGQTFVLSRDHVIFWVRFSSVVQKRLDVEHVEVGEIMGAFHSTKNSGLKFSKISRGKWNSKSGNFPVGYTSPEILVEWKAPYVNYFADAGFLFQSNENKPWS